MDGGAAPAAFGIEAISSSFCVRLSKQMFLVASDSLLSESLVLLKRPGHTMSSLTFELSHETCGTGLRASD